MTLRYFQRLLSILQEMSGKINAVLLSVPNAVKSVILGSPLGEERRMSSHNMKFTKLSLLFIIFFLSLPLFAENSEYKPENFQGEEQIKYVIKHYYTERYEGIKNLNNKIFPIKLQIGFRRLRNGRRKNRICASWSCMLQSFITWIIFTTISARFSLISLSSWWTKSFRNP